MDEKDRSELKKLLTELYELLREESFSVQSKYILKSIYALEKNDEELFKKRILSHEILGGAGSVSDIALFDNKKRKEFELLFNKIILKLKKNGYKVSWFSSLNKYLK